MFLDRILTALFDHSVKVVAAVLVLGGVFIWLTMPRPHPVATLQAHCQEQNLAVRVVKLEPGSREEERFLAMVPGGNRERLPEGHWAFCRANLGIRTRGDTQHEGR